MSIEFYERVIVRMHPNRPELVGASGYVLGVSERDDGSLYGYFVMFPHLERGFTLSSEWLEGTGEVRKRSDFYPEDGPTLRVGVKHGKGYLIDGEEHAKQ